MTRSNLDALRSKFQENREAVTESDFFALEELALSGNSEAACVLAIFLLQGNRSIYADEDEAIKWMTFAAENGNISAMEALGKGYAGDLDAPIDIPLDLNGAFFWLKKGYEAGSAACTKSLAMLYYSLKDYENAYSTFFESSGRGDIDSLIFMGELIDRGLVKEKDPKASFLLYQAAANAGNSHAQCAVANKYFEGQGTEKDIEKAANFWMKAAENDVAEAWFNLSVLHRTKAISNSSPAECIKCLQKAAELDHPVALHVLGMDYLEGLSTTKDSMKAIQYLERAANLGNTESKLALAVMYINGKEVEKNISKAYQLAEEASEENNEQAKNLLAMLKYMTYETKQDLESALNLFKQSKQKDPLSYYYMSEICKILEQSPKERLNYLKKGAKLGNPAALNTLGELYLEGKIVDIDLEKAFKLFKRAAAKGEPRALYNLGSMYFYGDLHEMDIQKAIHYFQKSADKGYPIAKYCLGLIYLENENVDQNLERSFNLILQSAEDDLPVAKEKLTEFYLYGLGVEQNIEKAIYWAEQAEQSGFYEGLKLLGEYYQDKEINEEKARYYLSKVSEYENQEKQTLQKETKSTLPKKLKKTQTKQTGKTKKPKKE